MDKKIWYAVIVGVVLSVFGMSLRGFAKAEGPQLILFFLTFFIIGIFATGARRSFLLGFVLALIYALVNTLIFSLENFTAAAGSVSTALAILLIGFLVPSLAAGVLSALGGLIGNRVFR